MATAATVTIRLDADSATLIRELNKAEQSTQATFRKMQADAAALARGFAVIGGAAAAAFTALAKSSFESIDALAKAADRMGIATEALKTLQVAADLAGVSQEQMNKSLLKQQQAIAKAVDGEKAYADAFRQLHLDTQELIKLPVDEQFNRIADALANVDNVTRRNNIALDIFGTRAAEMINLVQHGALSLGELRQYLEDVNVTVSRFDASKIEQANDSVTLAKAAFEGLGNTIAVAVAPVVQGLAEQFQDAARESNGFKDQVNDAMRATASAVAFVSDGVLGVRLSFDALAGAALKASGVVVSSVAQLGTAINELFVQPILSGLAAIANAGKVVATGFGLDELAGKAYGAEAGIDDIAKSLRQAAEAAREVGANLSGAGGAIFDEISASLNQELPSAAVDRWLNEVQVNSLAAAARTALGMKEAIDKAGGELEGAVGPDRGQGAAKALNTSGKDIKPDVPQFQAPLTPYLDPDFVREATALATAQYLEGWQLANEQRVEADQAVKDTLALSDEEAGKFLIQLAAQQAREKVIAEFEARGEALGETGQPVDPEAKAEFELALYDETLARERTYLDQRLQLQSRFGQQFIGFQTKLSKAFGKEWADSHKLTLNLMSGFATAAASIAQTMFGNSKAAAIANALVSTYQAYTVALASAPPPANFALAAATLAAGFAQVKSITSTSIGGGSGVSGAVASAPSIGTTSSPDTGALNKDLQADRQKSVQLIIHGGVYGWDDYIQSKVIDGIRSAVDDRDVILFSNSSRQAGELTGP